ncbi:predicted protein [Micromonas commoda]|uniref:Peptidase S74 domain-containing protein n=1 Tax=Micromonas commoda (strain RCC299 / NOUM17 / CCMP2709) TaxID=296587 RepID=C1FEK3_MICCC|nr:predicted protein [Micromonas commoda]ACO68583.1 predicted protein [Micromonas commoda]|eukprot:XP_002507325.1 predicted protein [Micromonas commoda]
MIDGTTATPLTGYKLQVEGDTLIRNGTKKYLDCYNDKVGIRVDADLIDLGCDVKIVGSTCVEGDLKIDGILKNGADKVFILQEDHDQDITEITDILDDIVNAIPTDENGNNEIPEGETLAYNSQITGLQTQVDNLPTISTVDTFIETKLASLHIIEGENANDPLALKHYLKDEVDALIPDVSNFETTTQLDTRLADYTTLSLFEAHETLMETELADKVDTTTLDNYDTSAQVDTKLSSYDTSAQVDTKLSSYDTSVEVDTKLNSYDTSTQVDNKIAGALADYDTSTEVDTKITNAGVGGHWTKDATTNELSYGAGRVKIDTNGEGLVVQPNTSDTDARINLISGEGDADAYIGFHARNPNSVHGRSVYIGAKASDTATNSVETELHFKVRGNNPYEWNTMVSDMVIKGDGDVEFQSPKLRILGGSWNTKFDLTNEGTICRKYTDTNNVDHGSGLHFSGDYIYPTDASGNLNNDVLSIGFPQHNRFKYIYASDSVFLNDYYEQSGSQYFGKRYNWHPFGILSGMEIENNTTGGNYSQKLHFLTHYYGVSNGRRMTINESGHVGIGTENPVAVLHVQGSRHANIAGGNNATLDWAGTGSGASMFYNSSTTYNVDIGIFASSRIATNADFVSAQGAFTHSDSRIKRDIKELNDDDALVKLRQIQPKIYGYKDIGVRPEEEVIGFIADEVEQVCPQAVRKTTSTIPNILEVVNVAESNIISFTNFNTSNLSETSSLECVDIRSGQEQYISIGKVIDDKTVQVKEDLSNWLGSFDEDGRLIVETTTSTLTTDEYEALENEEQEGYRKKDDVYEKTITSYPGNNLYIRGERVNDFRTLKKEMLFAINFSATQELDKSVEKLKVENEELKARLLALEEKINIA